MTKQRFFTTGFSLIEVLLSVAIISILAGLSAPVFATFQTRNDLDITTQSVVSALRRAQSYARGVSGNSQWGVAIQSTGATLFKGTSYASRDPNYDETIPFSTGMNTSGFTQVLYTKLDTAITTTPVATNSLTLIANTTETRTITINAKGMVSY